MDPRSPSSSPWGRAGSRPTHYRVADETPPESLFYSNKVQITLEKARCIVNRLSNVLFSSPFYLDSESSVNNLKRQGEKLKAFTLQSSRTVGLVGDSGAGKSSLINSLLDYTDLARASNSGQACTCVVTEYKYHERDDFMIEIEYLTMEELQLTFEDLLTNYRDYKSSTLSEKSTIDQKELEKKADIALSIFKTTFKGQLEDSPTVLSSMAFNIAVETMLDWARQLLPPPSVFGSGSPMRPQEWYTRAEDCSNRLSQLTSEATSPESRHQSHPWPLIKKITVHLNSFILSKDLVIADLPGLRDSNLARQNITERYIRVCHQILVVARIDRAITDQSIRDIFDLARRANLSNIGIVCTRSDDVDVAQAKHDWPRERKKIEQAMAAINALDEDLKALSNEDGFGSAAEENVLLKQREDLRTKKDTIRFELNEHLIQIRNDHVSDAVRKQYENQIPADILRIFCVSNTMYRKFRPKAMKYAEPRLQLSGIIALRRYCIGIVADSHYRATLDFVNDEVPAFVDSLRTWYESGSESASAERKDEVLEALDSVENELDELTSPVSELDDIFDTLQNLFRTHLREDMSQAQSVSKWSRSAGNASTYWHGWYHNTYSAFCKNYGIYSTAKQPYTNWNEEAMTAMVDDMTPEWDKFSKLINETLDEIKGFVKESFTTAISEAPTRAQMFNSRGMQSTSSPLVHTLRHRQRLAMRGIENIIDDFMDERLGRLRTDALSPVHTAFIGELMNGSYHAANMESGSGSDRRRKTLVTSRFGSSSLFHEHRRLVQNAFESLAKDLERQLKELVKEQVQLIINDINVIRNENVIEESERNPEFRERLGEEMRRASAELRGLRLGELLDDVE
ncbi:unnamed protein product [Periconia digitata]|uniref:Uncharacterized protein n=1 Tax=Periconia digitata TaxID=1303443 RepID=A0A9W4UE13_9PLEO|nr:unnamed protein product [Periconia digitata]